MADEKAVKVIFYEPERTLRALAMELKRPLTTMAKRAELGGEGVSTDILNMAEQSLTLIDSYLLMARAEYGQQMLELEPLGIGSILHEVSHMARPQLAAKTDIVIDDRAHEPVMANRRALISIVFSMTDVLSEQHKRHDSSERIVLRSYKSTSGRIGVGVFVDKPLAAQDLRRALELHGKAQMPMAGISSRSGVSIAIAESLCRSIGGVLEVKRMGRLMGLATILPKSEQLSLV